MFLNLNREYCGSDGKSIPLSRAFCNYVITAGSWQPETSAGTVHVVFWLRVNVDPQWCTDAMKL
eukprot:4359286-Amphidinium_carterae.1